MATSTTKLGLTKPAYTDVVDVQDLNTNADLIDAASGMTICTSSTRPGSPWSGQIIFETDTLGTFVWDGSAWQSAGGGGSITVAETAPTSPAPGNGDLWFNSTDGRTFVYYEDADSNQWVEIGQVLGGGGGASVTVDATAPASPSNGDLWWDTNNGEMYLYYDDGSSQQWVDAAGPSVAVQSTAPTGYEGQLWLDDTDGSMYVYYTDPGGGSSSWIGAVSRSGGILQVVSTTKTDTYSSSIATASFDSTVVTGLSASITPRSTSSKILVRVELYGTQSTSNYAIIQHRLERDGTAIGVGDAAGSRPQLSAKTSVVVNDSNSTIPAPAVYLDSPSTTSTVTYNVRLYNHNSATATYYVNRSVTDSDNRLGGRPVSTITLMEIAG